VWWALSLMTTVGFVGESPETTGGRLLSAVLMLIGFGVLSVTTAAIASLFVREDEASEERREHAFEQQPSSGWTSWDARSTGWSRGSPTAKGPKGPPVVASIRSLTAP
jgi:hypothetical protein